MQFNHDMYEELNLLLKFPTDSLMHGLKIHHDADPDVISAAQRLYDKGIIDQVDGGYLTDLGQDLINHAQMLHSALSADNAL